MKRRLTVIVLGLVAMGMLLAMYWLYVHGADDEGGGPGLRNVHRPTGGTAMDVRGVQVTEGTGTEILVYDKHHRLQMRYQSDEWKPMGEKAYLLRPRVEWYLRRGQIARIEADEGIVVAEDVGGKINVESGELTGDVWITLDRNTDPDRTPMAERPGDTLRIHVNELRFDNEKLTITSDSHVSLFAKEADILGRGLRIAWSEGPRELRELRIHHGEYMCIREGQERFVSETLLPGGAPERAKEAPAAAPPAPAESGRAAPGGLPPAALALAGAAMAATATAVEPSSRPASMPASAPASMPASALATMPASAPAVATTGPAHVVKETYQATLTDGVVVISGARHIRGADELRLVFEFRRPGDLEDEEADGQSPGVAVDTQPASPATRPAPAAEADEDEPAGPAQPLFVFWQGPLVLKPFRSHAGFKPPAAGDDAPKGNRFDVYAKGKRIELADGDSKGVCKSFEVHSPEQRGELVGTDDQPVVLTLPTGERVTSRLVRFHMVNREARLDGPGTMLLPSGSETAITRKPDGPAATATAAEDQQLAISWQQGVELAFGRQEATAGSKRREYLRTARFIGGVRARQAETQSLKAGELLVKFKEPTGPDDKLNQAESVHASGGVRLDDTVSGDYIAAETLDVDMVLTAEGKTVPSEARASGTVTARQENTDIAADRLGVTFAYGTDPKDPKDTKRRIRPTELNAAGHVKITDHGDPDKVTGLRDPDELIVATADTLATDIAARTATLTGKMATVTQKDNIVSGEEIFLDQNGEAAAVTGAGKLRFYSDTDISGNKTKTPRPVNIAWAKGMTFSGKARQATIFGGVKLVTAGDTMECEHLTVDFEPPEQTPEPTTMPTTRPAGRVKVESERFRAQRIKQVTARKDVRLESVRKDADGYLQYRVMLKTPKLLTYGPKAKQIDCTGPGTLSVEDYQAPKKKAAAGDRGDVLELGSMARPSQSAFEWSDSMMMNQQDYLVHMTGDVKLAHRSGQKVLLSKRLSIRPFAEALPPGRMTMLVCDALLAKFAEPEGAARPAGVDPVRGPLSGPRSVDLILFDAKGVKSDVNLTDGPRQVLCRKVVYRKATDTAVIWGSLPHEPVKDAVLYYNDPKTRRITSWRSPKITWHRTTNRVISEKVRLDGGR